MYPAIIFLISLFFSATTVHHMIADIMDCLGSIYRNREYKDDPITFILLCISCVFWFWFYLLTH
jgi:hypothetical protein